MKKTQRNGGISESHPLPDPIELAKLAAILERDNPRKGVEQAMRFYVEAVAFSQDLKEANLSSDGILIHFGSYKRNLVAAKKQLADNIPHWNIPALNLEPDKDTDDVRTFLDTQARDAGLLHKREHLFKEARLVLSNLEDCRDSGFIVATSASKPLPPADEFREHLKYTAEDGSTYYAIPKVWLQNLIDYKKAQASERAKRGAETKRSSPTAEKPSKKISKKLRHNQPND